MNGASILSKLKILLSNQRTERSGKPRVLVFGPFRLDIANRRLTRNGAPAAIKSKCFDLLALLASRPGELVTRDEIRCALWPDRTVEFDQSINASIREIRACLGDSAQEPKFIRTEPKHGYVFIAPATPAQAAPARRRNWIAAAAATALALFAGAFFAMRINPSDLAVRPATASAGWSEYARGQALLETHSPADAMAAQTHFRAALDRDPDYAEAWAGLADALYFAGGRPDEAMPAVLDAAEQALDRAPDMPRALLRKADVLFSWEWDFAAAEKLYRRAIEADPAFTDAHHSFAAFLLACGDIARARASMERAVALDPLSAVLNSDMAWTLTLIGDYEEALRQCDLLREIAPNNPRTLICGMRAGIELGRLDDAAAAARSLLTIRAPELAAEIRASSPERQIAEYYRWAAAQFESQGRGHSVAAALAHARLGDPARALAALEGALSARDRLMPYIHLYPEFRALANSERFSTIVAEVGAAETAVF
ncbi:MAG: hypothetical protein Tsb0010_16320 [Parvularculaceae bacterium]